MTRLIVLGLLVASAYILFARLGFRVAFVAEQVTTVWPPTGIAQAALILWSVRLWPAVWIGAFVANLAATTPLLVAGAIATGNTLEAVVAAIALARVGFNPALNRTRDTLALIVLAVIASPMVSATIGTIALCAGGVQPWGRFTVLWGEWWLGDALGALVVAPLLLTTLRPGVALTRRRLGESAGWVVAAMTVTALVLTSRVAPFPGQFALTFAIFPFVIVSAVRLGHPATPFVVAGTALVMIWSTVREASALSHPEFHEALILSQVFMSVFAGSGLLLASAVAERRVLERRRSAAYGAGEILSRSNSLEDAAPQVLELIGANLNWQVGALWIADRGGDTLRCIHVWCAPDTVAPEFIQLTRNTRFVRGVGLPGRVWATGDPAWIQDVVHDANFPRAPIARKEGLHGAFGFPICMGDDVLGVVEYFNRAVEVPDVDLLGTMAAIGVEIGGFIGRKRMEAAAAESQSRTRAILDTALDGIISMDHRGVVVEFNAAAEHMFGIARHDAIGRELATLLIPDALREPHRIGLRAHLESGKGAFIDKRIETTAMRAGGGQFPVEVSITRVPTDPPLFTGFIRDLTARVEAERERQQLLERELAARQQAEAANRAKDMFLATLSHELRTPLNAIVGWTRMLIDGTLDKGTASRALQIVDRNAQVQLHLVEDILDVSRIVTGKLTLEIQPVDLGAIVGVVIESVRPAAEAKRLRIRSTLSGSARLTAGDPKRLQQVIWNLVSNALKFTENGGAIDIAVLDCPPASVCIKVTDNGAGITPAFLPRLFERFTQADSSTTRQHGGLGLGLAIARHLVELHGGTIRAESAGAGRGSTFTVDLPRIDADVAATPEPPRAERTLSARAALAGCRLLVVEDEVDARELLAAMLSLAGATVETTATVDEALAIVDRSAPDVLLSDIGLVGKDGYDLIREVNTRKAGRDLRIATIAVTAYARAQDRTRALEAGFDAYVAKPIDESIVDTVAELCKATVVRRAQT